MAIADDPTCVPRDDVKPTRLASGQLGFVRLCGGVSPRTEVLTLEDSVVTPLARLEWNPGRFDWSSIADLGVFSHGVGYCVGWSWFDRDGRVPTTVFVGEGAQRFRVDEVFDRSHPENCDGTGRAGGPTWSANGGQLAFLASPESVGVEGDDRLGRPWGLYVANRDGTEAREIVGDLSEPAGVRWSHDGQWLAYVIASGSSDRTLWITNPDGSVKRRLYTGSIHDFDWAPSSQEIVVLEGYGQMNRTESEVVILTLTDEAFDRPSSRSGR
jgi:hypothetical protein